MMLLELLLPSFNTLIRNNRVIFQSSLLHCDNWLVSVLTC